MKLIVFILIAVILASIGGSLYLEIKTQQLKAQAIVPTPPVFSEDKLWSLIQKWRTDNGFQPYIKDQRLCTIAQDRVTNDPPLDEHAGLYKKYSNYPYVLQENLNESDTEQNMLASWIQSAPHLATLKKPYTSSCIVCKNIQSGTYCAQEFSSFLTN